jgi:hypothetical protein
VDPDVHHFIEDEGGFRAWSARHPSGFVVMVERTVRGPRLSFHLAACDRLTGRDPLKTDYICSEKRVPPEHVAHERFGVFPPECRICRPP